MHFYRREVRKDNVDQDRRGIKLHFYSTELSEDYVDFTGEDKLHFYRREVPKIM